MGLSDYINPELSRKDPEKSKDACIKCICGETFTSGRKRSRHAIKCSFIREQSEIRDQSNPMKSNTEAGYHLGAHVAIHTSQVKFRTRIRLQNRMRNDRAVTRSHALHTEPAIVEMGSVNVRSPNDEDDQMFDSHNDTMDPDEVDITGIDPEAASVVSVECEEYEDEDEEEEEEDEEDDEWEDIDDDTEDIQQRLRNIKLNHNRRWSKFRMADGYVRGGSAKPFKYGGNLPMIYIAQVSLLKILSQHRGNDLKLFDRIMNWVEHFSNKDPNIWSKRTLHRHRTRKTFIPYLADFFQAKDLIPAKKTALMADGSKVDMPVYDFKSVFERMMLDPELINEENLIKNNFDPKTWRPIKKYKDLAPHDTVDDLTTGCLYEKGIELYCDDPPPAGIARILPTPIILFTDEAHHDKKNGNKTGPMSMCPAVVKQDVRAKDSSWFNIAYLPNYGLGRGKYYGNYDDKWEDQDGKKKGLKTLTQDKLREMKVKDHQTLYDTALQSFRDYCDTYGGLRMMWQGELCLAKPFLLMVIGDTKEYNMITNKYNSNRARCPCKCCLCTWEDIGTKFPPTCQRVTLAHIEKAMEDKDYAKSISFHQETSVWNNLPIADIEEGIGGMCPLEWLHLNGQGNFKDGPDVIHDIIGEGQTKKSKKEELDLLFKAVAEDIKRNSERDFPIMALRFAIMDLTNVTANERVGNYFILIICLTSKRGRAIMKASLKEAGIDIEDMINTMTALLAYDSWCRSFGVPKWELDNAGPAVANLMEDMTKHLPKEVKDGSHGYHKVKFHGLWLSLDFMRKYGSGRNTTGEHGERLHKIVVGLIGDGTQKRPAKFTVQCGQRDGERTVIDKAFKYVKHECPVEMFYNCEEADEDPFEESVEMFNHTWLGGYTLSAPSYTGRMNVVDYQVRWDSTHRTAAGIELHKHLLHCLTCWAIKHEYTGSYSVTGYTELRMRNDCGERHIYRANDYYHGGGWYDWALVRDPKNADIKFIGKILGFFKYDTPGFPTYRYVELDGIDKDIIRRDRMRDDTMYAVVIGSTKVMDEANLDSRIATPFRLSSGDDAYIIPVSCILKPVMVVRNFGSTTSTGYLHCLPQRKWPSLFSKLIRMTMVRKSPH